MKVTDKGGVATNADAVLGPVLIRVDPGRETVASPTHQVIRDLRPLLVSLDGVTQELVHLRVDLMMLREELENRSLEGRWRRVKVWLGSLVRRVRHGR